MLSYIIREPLLNSKQEVLGYELFFQNTDVEGWKQNDEKLKSLYVYVGNHLNNEFGWVMGDLLLFVETTPTLVNCTTLNSLPPNKTVLIFDATKLDRLTGKDVLKSARENGFETLLRGVDLSVLDKEWLNFVTYVEVDYKKDNVGDFVNTYAKIEALFPAKMVVCNTNSWQEHSRCALIGLDAFVCKLHLTPKEAHRQKRINSSQALTLKLMNDLREGKDIAELEEALKHDPALSYKLLRYINSAGFGGRSKVDSMRHAVMLIGFTPLYRWLSLLLVTSSINENAAILMQTAIIRGRMLELLSEGDVLKSGLDNMFVMGMFSLIDRLLEIPMEEVLKHIPLPEADIALLNRKGRYGAFLALVEACELRNGLADVLADSLSLEPATVNKAHMEALAWAQSFSA